MLVEESDELLNVLRKVGWVDSYLRQSLTSLACGKRRNFSIFAALWRSAGVIARHCWISHSSASAKLVATLTIRSIEKGFVGKALLPFDGVLASPDTSRSSVPLDGVGVDGVGDAAGVFETEVVHHQAAHPLTKLLAGLGFVVPMGWSVGIVAIQFIDLLSN